MVPLLSFFFFFYCYGAHRDLPSFPTRRSSDLAPGLVITPDDLDAAERASGLALATGDVLLLRTGGTLRRDRKSTRLNSSHVEISYAVFCLKKKKKKQNRTTDSSRGSRLVVHHA